MLSYFRNDARRLNLELEQFNRNFPYSIPRSIGQDSYTGRVVVRIFPVFEGIQHEVHLVYSNIHPDFEMDAFVVYPRLDHRYMGHHWYDDDKICYVREWNRSWTVLKVSVQVMCWLTDYYREKNGKARRSFGF